MKFFDTVIKYLSTINIRLLMAAALLSAADVASAQKFVDHGPAGSLIETSVYFQAGSSLITENYMGCYPEIRELNTSPGTSLGVGLTGVLGLRDWLGVGTEIGLTTVSYRTDMAVSNDESTSESLIFLRNNACYLTVPVFMQFRFNIAGGVRWTVDSGLYYNYGVGGKQKQSIYHTQINSLGQLIPTRIVTEPRYFNSSGTFIHANYRGDIGLHLASGLTFRHRLSLGVRFQLGFKDIAYIPGGSISSSPNVHNVSYHFRLGYTL